MYGGQIVNPSDESNKPSEVFNHFVLTQNQETAKYLGYDRVAFPKIFERKPDGTTVPASSADLDSMWMIGVMDYEKRIEKELALKDVEKFISLPGGRVLPGVASSLRKIYDSEERRQSRNADSSRNLNTAFDTSMTKPTQNSVKYKSSRKPREKNNKKARRNNKLKRLPHDVYASQAAKISKAFKENQSRPEDVKMVRSKAIENLIEIERRNVSAVICLQRFWRRWKAKEYWRSVVRKHRAIIVMQRFSRGVIARSMLKTWLLRKTWLVILVQSAVRRFMANTFAKDRRLIETGAARSIQRVVRGYLARIRADIFRSHATAIKIQRYWRGSVARVRVDRLWIGVQVTKVQKIVRGHIARERVREKAIEYHSAALMIQCAIRGVMARWKRSDMLLDREENNKKFHLDVLRCEDAYYCAHIEKLRKRFKEVHRVADKVAMTQKQCEQMEDDLLEKEWDYLALQRERKRIDPEGVAQGWREELDKNVTEHRQLLTEAKLEYLFSGALNYRESLELANKLDGEIKFCEQEHARVRRDRERETLMYMEFIRDRSFEKDRRYRRRRIADQKRIWRVEWRTSDGKIDKKRRPGYAWETTENGVREGFNVGSVDLAPNIANDKSGNHFDTLCNHIALQNSQNQIVQYGALLAPLIEGMEKMSAAVVSLGMENQFQPGGGLQEFQEPPFMLEDV